MACKQLKHAHFSFSDRVQLSKDLLHQRSKSFVELVDDMYDTTLHVVVEDREARQALRV